MLQNKRLDEIIEEANILNKAQEFMIDQLKQQLENL